jgi:hypothetical protein
MYVRNGFPHKDLMTKKRKEGREKGKKEEREDRRKERRKKESKDTHAPVSNVHVLVS